MGHSRGLAFVLAIIRAMDAATFQTDSDILFIGNVGEEGEGDLDGITNGGIGSRRYRVTFTEPGGHS